MSDFSYEQFAKMCDEAGIGSDNKSEMETDFRVGTALSDLVADLETLMEAQPNMDTPHQGFDVLKERQAALWAHVQAPGGERNIEAMRKEAIQVAAAAVRFAADVCWEGKGHN